MSKIDRLMEEASEALVSTEYFRSERLSLEALSLAHQAQDYERMTRILLPLQEARRQKREQAADVRKIVRLSKPADLEPLLNASKPIKAGCYLLEPPLVGADGRDLRERADAEQAPVVILVREPETKAGKWPVVMVGPVTVRIRIDPPKRPDVAWMLRASEALGDAAIAGVNPEECAGDRVERLIQRLGTIVDHEKLHQALGEACSAAAYEAMLPSKKNAKAARDRALAEGEEDGDEDDA